MVVALVVFGSVGSIGGILARGFARRIGGGGSSREVDALRDEVAQLRAEVDDLHARVGDVNEIQNRLDFAERVIGQLKGKGALPGGGG